MFKSFIYVFEVLFSFFPSPLNGIPFTVKLDYLLKCNKGNCSVFHFFSKRVPCENEASLSTERNDLRKGRIFILFHPKAKGSATWFPRNRCPRSLDDIPRRRHFLTERVGHWLTTPNGMCDVRFGLLSVHLSPNSH
ncbi:hypothetical protein CDAR_66531 [Caerostris darwini]|uniref:Secreted protein n=1 Tax=Caerostris darwini TaxID=1538125 RepID=A0AAV4WZX8_9ARAC|nr:hypothetical protein CDAR_66531 [Caerostris darwini]